MFRIIATTLAAGALAIPATITAAEIEIEAEGPVIELSVYESVTAEPDMATIGAGVTTQAPTAVEAMRQNAVEMRRVIDQIKALGVDERDIQTTGINLNPRYDYNRTTQENEFRGYQVSNRVSVKLRAIEETGRVLDALVATGATDLSGPRFSIEDDTAAKEQARERAFERATDRAEAYAELLGFEQVRVLEISESIQGREPIIEQSLRSTADAELAAAPPVQPGMVSTGVSVTMKFEVISGEDEEVEEE
ncbi:MAG: SIMPL domain-containing protein [Pseudomonadota bacterium]